jgi:hypothetical protein
MYGFAKFVPRLLLFHSNPSPVDAFCSFLSAPPILSKFFTMFFAENYTPISSHVKANSRYNLSLFIFFDFLFQFISRYGLSSSLTLLLSAILFSSLLPHATTPSMDISTFRFRLFFSFHFPLIASFSSTAPFTTQLQHATDHFTPNSQSTHFSFLFPKFSRLR